ncbi:MAG TPA: mandelate racemase/muconate lactonizing enzyme family protein [Candidatus Paceibacterota bacterium]|nr:mandelate racemase/muconate lactonizing enzyme family protein [Candidatus Paceibacterota bacterium]
MKIVQVEIAGLRGATPKGGWSAELEPENVVHTLLAIKTEGGVVGVGSIFTSDSLVRSSLEVLQPLLIGETALEPERVSEKLHQNTFWLGRGGAITHTISGIDTALWDLFGKITGQPIGRLLGGRVREKVMPYASLLMEEPKSMTEKLLGLRSQGFRAFKIGWGTFGRIDSSNDELLVKTAREAIGDECFLAVDAGGSDAYWRGNLNWAINTSKMLNEYAVDWFEEALRPDDLQDFRQLRIQSSVPISGGEVLTRRQSFTPFLVSGAFDIIQPDVTKVGGISEFRRIAHTADEFGVRVIPHGWNTAIGLAVDLQLASAILSADKVEYCTGSAYVDDLSEMPWRLDEDGLLEIPTHPGIGFSLDPEKVERYSGVRGFLD